MTSTFVFLVSVCVGPPWRFLFSVTRVFVCERAWFPREGRAWFTRENGSVGAPDDFPGGTSRLVAVAFGVGEKSYRWIGGVGFLAYAGGGLR